MFKNKRITLIGESYYVELKENVYMAIVQIEGSTSRIKELEAYIVRIGNKRVEASKVCATCDNQSSMLDSALRELYKVAETSGKKITLDCKTSKFISDFLGE